MPGRFPFRVRIANNVTAALPPAVEKIARNGGVFAMIERGAHLIEVSFDDAEKPTEAIFAFGDDQVVFFRADSPSSKT